MKKYINLMAVATVCLIACNKLSENVVESVKTQVSCLLDDSQTKTDLTGTVGLLWSTDDAISVATQSGVKTFTLASGAGTNSAVFSIDESVVVNESATAFYPATMTPAWSSGDNAWQATIPDTYTWSQWGVKAPMVGWVNKDDPYFGLMTGVIRLDVVNIPTTAKKLLFKTTNGKRVSGLFTLNGSNKIDTQDTDNPDLQRITIDFSSSAYQNTRVFFIPVPAGSYTFTVEMLDSDDNYIDGTRKTVSSAQTIAGGTIMYTKAFSLGTIATETLWSGSYDAGTSWAWHEEDVDLSTLQAGDRLRFVFTEGETTYWQLKPLYYSGTASNWVIVSEAYDIFDLASGQTMLDIVLTEALASDIHAGTKLTLQGYGVTYTAIQRIPVQPETIVWFGSVEMGNWENSIYDEGLRNTAFWSSLLAGKTITVYYSPNMSGNDPQIALKKGTDWADIVSASLPKKNQDFISFVLTDAQATLIKENGLIVQGKDATVTKITLR